MEFDYIQLNARIWSCQILMCICIWNLNTHYKDVKLSSTCLVSLSLLTILICGDSFLLCLVLIRSGRCTHTCHTLPVRYGNTSTITEQGITNQRRCKTLCWTGLHKIIIQSYLLQTRKLTEPPFFVISLSRSFQT